MTARRPKPRPIYRREILSAIRSLHRAGEPLNITAMKRRHPELIARSFSIRPFLGWKGALEAAGIKYADIEVELASEVTCRICGRRMRMLAPHITRVHGITCEDYRFDYPGAELVCEERRAQLMGKDVSTGKESRHLLIRHWEPVWSAEYVLDRIAELHRRGFHINARAVFSEDGVGEQAVKYFGSWDAALERVGLDPGEIRIFAPYREWTPEAVIEAIRQRHDTGQPLNARDIKHGPDADVMLHTCGQRFFGSWIKAVTKAGLDPKQAKTPRPANYPTEDSVLSAIRARHRAGLPISSRAIRTGPDRDGTLFKNAGKHFGTWERAIEAAGFDYDMIREKPRNPYRSRSAVVKAIRARRRKGQTLTVSSLRVGPHRDQSLIGAAVRHFGRWSLAVEAACGS